MGWVHPRRFYAAFISLNPHCCAGHWFWRSHGGGFFIQPGHWLPNHCGCDRDQSCGCGGGVVSSSSTSTILGTFDERLIITDVVLTYYGSYSSTQPCLNPVSVDSGGGELARYHLSSDTYHNGTYLQPNQVSHTYSSGLPVEPGVEVGITNHGSNCEVAYSISGYLAQP